MSDDQLHLDTIAKLHEAQSRIRQLEATLNDAYIQRDQARRGLHLARQALRHVAAIADEALAEYDRAERVRPSPIVEPPATVNKMAVGGAYNWRSDRDVTGAEVV